MSDAELERVLTAAVRLYAAKAETDKPPAQPITPSAVTPTDVVVTVSDLIRAAGLNLWDVSMWFTERSRFRVGSLPAPHDVVSVGKYA